MSETEAAGPKGSGEEYVPGQREDEAHMGVHLLQHLREHGPGLVGALHVVQKDELRRVGHIDRTVRLVVRVLAGSDDRQRRAIRAELRAHGHAGDKVRVCGQARVQELLNRAIEDRRCDELAGRQWQKTPAVFPSVVVDVPTIVIVAVPDIVLASPFLTIILACL